RHLGRVEYAVTGTADHISEEGHRHLRHAGGTRSFQCAAARGTDRHPSPAFPNSLRGRHDLGREVTVSLRRRLDRIQAELPPPPKLDPLLEQRKQAWRAVCMRWLGMMDDARALMSPDQQGALDAAVAEVNDCRSPLYQWARDLRKGWCR